MLRHILLTLLMTCCAVPFGRAQVPSRDTSFILLVVPESDTTTTSTSVYRLSASTNPGNKVTINNKDFKVYPSGAFTGLLDLEAGENLFTITSTDDSSRTMTRSFVVIRSKPLESTPEDTLAIEDAMMQPDSDMWLNEGDLLEVRIKGTPGCVATFLNGNIMQELPRSKANGLEGVYRGTYKVLPTDTLMNQRIEFRLVTKDGKTVTKKSTARISLRPRDFPMVGITKGERVYLDFGLGDDRLGGAKFSFIQDGISLAITGKVSGRYRVRLAENQEAWIPENQVDLQPLGTPVPYSLTGNWSVSGDEKYDYVTVSLAARLPYSSFQESDPSRINIDVYGAVSNSNWITQQLSTKEIKNVYYTQVAKQQFRITIELNHKQIWGYQVGYKGNSLSIKVRRQPEQLKLKAMTIALDAGHGGSNNGALGCTGAKEKDVALSIVKRLQATLAREGARVVLTRTTDSNLTTIDRLKTIWTSEADILVSIHANSVGLTTNPADISGTSTYYKHVCFRPLSMCILQQIIETGLTSFGNVGGFNFSLNSPTELPNALVETAFISNPEDEMKLLDPEFQDDLAKHIAGGIEDFLESCEED